MIWTAIVPIKGGDDRKSRLSRRLDREERIRLSNAMAAHVLGCLGQVPAIGEIHTLSPDPIPPFLWRQDMGRGLNSEMDAFRVDMGVEPLLVIHGDLPLLHPDEVSALLTVAESSGGAIAPDRHGEGTNALALIAIDDFRFTFGEKSYAAHVSAMRGKAVSLKRKGLTHDVDTPEDLDAITAATCGDAATFSAKFVLRSSCREL